MRLFSSQSEPASGIVSRIVDPRGENLAFYARDDQGKPFGSFLRLKDSLAKRKQFLTFAMNGGMFSPNLTPVGLYIEEYRTLTPLVTGKGDGNFFLLPNGVLYLTRDNRPAICMTPDFKPSKDIRFATQSGPMLLIGGTMHPAFRKGSQNLNLRNGAGILPDGRLLFAIATAPINFYDFATYFQQQGCREALYLDGFVSRMYCPERGQLLMDGNFGVIICVSKPG